MTGDYSLRFISVSFQRKARVFPRRALLFKDALAGLRLADYFDLLLLLASPVSVLNVIGATCRAAEQIRFHHFTHSNFISTAFLFSIAEYLITSILPADTLTRTSPLSLVNSASLAFATAAGNSPQLISF